MSAEGETKLQSLPCGYRQGLTVAVIMNPSPGTIEDPLCRGAEGTWETLSSCKHHSDPFEMSPAILNRERQYCGCAYNLIYLLVWLTAERYEKILETNA
ncbi:hypothetical protein TNCV_1168191 [Trichonephila clavipes]|uniref:Uncharacterized protein n=1 Tax=Trichonephila clavipes TaxID=2585209 RepID=A0A8X6SX83_TRICX|nr:hypothetical protein TNCV_1168191 [Trichonephila clavipes]